MQRISAKIDQHHTRKQKAKIPLDKVLAKSGRGRPATVNASEITGRADNYRSILDQVWDELWPILSKARTKEDVINAFEEGAKPYERDFMPALAPLVLKVLRDPKIPRRKPASRINFLADSLAGLGRVTARRSRDVCEQERAKAKQSHFIIRYEFLVECSCGYKGRSRNHACPKCGARIVF